MKVNFTCPNCGEDGNHVEEVLTSVTQYSRVTDLTQDGEEARADYDEVDFDTANAEVESYRCAHCCEVLTDEKGVVVADEIALLAWLSARGMLTED